MEELRWNFVSPTELEITFIPSIRRIIVHGEITDNTFYASSEDVDNNPLLNDQEKGELKALLRHRTRNDRIIIIFE